MPETTELLERKAPVSGRRRRYERSPPPERLIGLTPTKVQMLRYLSELRFLSLPQLAKLCCPSERQDLSERSARRHMRELFDGGLVDVLAISRAALASPDESNDATLLYGSAPNIYALTRQGLELLYRGGLIHKDEAKRPGPAYGPRNTLFLAHEVAIRDVRVWLERAAQANGYEIECWRDGEAAAINLQGLKTQKQVRPDCWFVYRLGKIVLVGLVEVDRGTERGDHRWREKLAAYAALFAEGTLPKVTGYQNARVLVFCPTARRREWLSEIIRDVGGMIASRFWVAEQTELEELHLQLPRWQRPGHPGLHALVPQSSDRSDL